MCSSQDYSRPIQDLREITLSFGLAMLHSLRTRRSIGMARLQSFTYWNPARMAEMAARLSSSILVPTDLPEALQLGTP